MYSPEEYSHREQSSDMGAVKAVPRTSEMSIGEYSKLFIQRHPRYAIKFTGGHWHTKKKPLADLAILAHLEGKYNIGVLGQWYPQYAIIDIDDKPLSFVEDVRGALGLNDSNSMLCDSESKDSYHIITRPIRNNKPPTIRHLQDCFKNFALSHGIELYPQANRTIRLPFGKYQNILDLNLAHIQGWNDKLFWFMKLDEFDLSNIPIQQYFLDFQYSDKLAENNKLSLEPSIMQQAKELLVTGLQSHSSRHDSQWKVLSYYARNNMPKEQAVTLVYNWAKTKHNGFSKDIVRNPLQVLKEIERQAESVYLFYESIYPDRIHNQHKGYICKQDLTDIIHITGGNMPRSKFLFEIVKYSYPRRYRTFINIHSKMLNKWASIRTYQKYLNELANKGIVKRGKAYQTDIFSKSLKLNWKYRSDKEAVLFSERSINRFKDTLQLVYKPEELRELLKSAGTERTTAIEAVKNVFEVSKKA